MTETLNGWRQVTLRSVCEPTQLWNPQRDPRHEFWYVDVSAVSRESYSIRQPENVKASNAPSRARKIIRANDTIFATVRPRLRRVAFVNSKFDDQIASTAFCVVRPDKQQAVPRFIYYLLLTDFLNEEIAKFESGASYPAVNDKHVLDQVIALPTRTEQERVAAVLWKVQSAIGVEDKLIASTRELKQSVMRYLFTHGLRGERQKETDVGPVPESWRVDRLVELVHFQRGFDITKKQQQLGSVPVVSSGGVKSWHNEVGANGPGVILGRKGSIGSVHYIDEDYWPHDTTLWSTDFRGNHPLFVYYRLLLVNLKKLDSGAANPALNRNFVHEELASWPEDVNEQCEIARALQTIDRKISIHERKHATLQELFKTLLYQLMTGEIRVDKVDIDTSEVEAAN